MRQTEYLKPSDKLIRDLKKMPVLSSLKDKEIAHLLKMSKMRQYEAGETICKQGSHDKWIYFLTKGSVKIAAGGKELSVLTKQGEIFGEMSAIDGAPRSASVYAVSDTICLATDTRYIERLSGDEKLAFSYLIYRIFAEILANRLRKSNIELMKARSASPFAPIKDLFAKFFSS